MEVAAVNGGGTGPYSDPALTVETLQDGEYMQSVHSVVVLPCFGFICVRVFICELAYIVHTQSTAIHFNAIYYSMLYIKNHGNY